MTHKFLPQTVSRRNIFGLGAGLLAGAGAAKVVTAEGNGAVTDLQLADLRQSIDATDFGLRGSTRIDQSRLFAEALNAAQQAGRPLYLGPGSYQLSNIDLPDGSNIQGIPGQTKILYSGEGHLLRATNAQSIRLSGISFDGENRPFAERNEALFHARNVAQVEIDNCEFRGSYGSSVLLEKCGGLISNNSIFGSQHAGIQSFNGLGLDVADNTVVGSGNIGIGIWRWQPGSDGSQLRNNRISQTAALSGGTGQNGNGVSIFQAHDVRISQNLITDSAFSAVRNNGGHNVQITGNECLRSAEVAIFVEFAFEGCLISDNLIDDAGDGISVSNFDSGGRLALIQGNLIRNINRDFSAPDWVGKTGVGIHAEADTLISGNVIEVARIAGIRAGWGKFRRNLLVSANLVRQTPVGIMYSDVDGGGSILIRDNLIEAAPDGGVVGYRWQNPSTGDVSDNGGRLGEGISVAGNMVS
jgi:uncharacterized secreted repeat protein (TIGR03808 family)